MSTADIRELTYGRCLVLLKLPKLPLLPALPVDLWHRRNVGLPSCKMLGVAQLANVFFRLLHLAVLGILFNLAIVELSLLPASCFPANLRDEEAT